MDTKKTNPFENIEEPWLTNVMPCYNDGKRVYEAIFSIMNQDYPNTELIVVNDGSTDNSRSQIVKAQKAMTEEQRERFRFIDLNENVGACRARNIGAAQRRPETRYLTWMPADAYMYPGVVKYWVHHLEQNPQAAGIYGSYKFIPPKQPFGIQTNDDRAWGGGSFDPYLLETSNYIDGTFPIRVELFEKMAEWNKKHYKTDDVGGWDHHIKSLQDYEFWLHAVKIHGARLLSSPSVFFETDFPHAGGLSDDSSNNWLERMDAIKNKLGVPLRNTCVVAMGAEHHAINIAKMIDADFSKQPNAKQNHYETMYVIGGYPMFAQQVAQALMHNDKPVYCPAKFIMHWIGSDIMHLRELSRNALDKYTAWLKNIIDIHLVEAKHTQKELYDLTGIKAKIVPIPSDKMYDLMPLPKKPTVAVYQPGGKVNEWLYMSKLIQDTAKLMPDVNFIFYGVYEDRKRKKKNVTYLPWNPDPDAMKQLIADTTVLLRLTTHDGLPLSIGEFASAGRNVVTNVPMPYCRVITGKLDADGVARTIRKSLADPVNKDGAKYYTQLFDKKKYRASLKKLSQFDPKKYWEKRASTWETQGDIEFDPKEVKVVTNVIKKQGFKSVLDVGFGNGIWTTVLPEDYMGIDIADNNTQIARKKYEDKEFYTSSLEDLDKNIQRGEKFDFAFCHTILMHVPDTKIKKAVENLKKFAKKAIIIEPTNMETGFYQIKHDINELFDVELTIPLPKRTLYLCNLE